LPQCNPPFQGEGNNLPLFKKVLQEAPLINNHDGAFLIFTFWTGKKKIKARVKNRVDLAII